MENLVLPTVIAQFIDAVNAGNLTALVAAFTPDAIVNDQLQDWHGTAAITRWATHDVIGDKLSFRPMHCLQHYGHCIVMAHADGSFDKRGLPDPLEVHLYFTLADEKIVQLIVLRNRSGTSRFGALIEGSS